MGVVFVGALIGYYATKPDQKNRLHNQNPASSATEVSAEPKPSAATDKPAVEAEPKPAETSVPAPKPTPKQQSPTPTPKPVTTPTLTVGALQHSVMWAPGDCKIQLSASLSATGSTMGRVEFYVQAVGGSSDTYIAYFSGSQNAVTKQATLITPGTYDVTVSMKAFTSNGATVQYSGATSSIAKCG